MKVGITGHQDRPGIDWAWVSEVLDNQLKALPPPLVGLSSLAQGADQIFAEAVIKAGGAIQFVLPTADYERHFEGEWHSRFKTLANAASSVIAIPTYASDQDAFMAAGEYIASHSDVLMAVWDGKPAGGKGGTADVVAFAKKRHIAVLHINPTSQTVERI